MGGRESKNKGCMSKQDGADYRMSGEKKNISSNCESERIRKEMGGTEIIKRR